MRTHVNLRILVHVGYLVNNIPNKQENSSSLVTLSTHVKLQYTYWAYHDRSHEPSIRHVLQITSITSLQYHEWNQKSRIMGYIKYNTEKKVPVGNRCQRVLFVKKCISRPHIPQFCPLINMISMGI